MDEQDRSVYRKHTDPNAPKRRRVRKPVRRLLVLLCVMAVMVAGAWLITTWVQREAPAPAASSAAPPAQTAPVVSLPASQPPVEALAALMPEGPAHAWMPEIDDHLWNTLDILPAPEGRPGPTAPDYRMFALPENGYVDMAYFDTAVFVGDSITQGLYLYKQGIPNAKYCAYKSISPRQIFDGSVQTNQAGGKEAPMDALVAHQPDNVYVLLGTNAMVAMEDDILLAYYDEMLNVMRERLGPAVNIYVQSITPVVQGVDRRFSFDSIRYLNDNLARMSFEKGMYFIDLHEALAGDDGWLRPDFGARDGYHLQPVGYAAWVKYLRSHTVYRPQHAALYIEGPGYAGYTQAPLPGTEEPPPEGEEPPPEG